MFENPLSFTDGAARFTVSIGKSSQTPGTGIRFSSATAARSFFDRIAANPANRQVFARLVEALVVEGGQVSMGRLLGAIALKALTGDLHIRRVPPVGPPSPPPPATTQPPKVSPEWRPTPTSLTLDEMRRLVRENNKSGLSDDLIVCLAYKESTFNPSVKNPIPGMTATGLMQMTVDAVTDVNTNYKAFGANFTHADMTDPVKNIQAGSWYLKLRIKRRKGNVSEGLARYGTGSAYAAVLLKCEQCRKAKPDSIDCLKALHS